MTAKTFFGFEEILAKELQILGAQHVEIGTRVVSFKGDKGFMYKANLLFILLFLALNLLLKHVLHM